MNRKTSEQRQAELAEVILNFLAEQMRAVTLGEIVEWWIARQPSHFDIHAVARALNQLIEKNLLEGIGEGRTRRYRLKIAAKSYE